VCAVVVGGSLVFWAVVLGSDRVTSWIVGRLRRASAIVSRRIPALGRHDLVEGFLAARASLREVARRPVGLLLRTALAQAVGAVILLVALRGLGVGAELGSIEFARVFFVVTLLSSFVPVPGGVGVVEAGLTGALVAAGMPFLLLVGAAPNAIAYESKQFTSGEFFKAGVPASLLLMVVVSVFVIFIWPIMGMQVNIPTP